METEAPTPIAFDSLKHHFLAAIRLTREARGDPSRLVDRLASMSGVVDVYEGMLMPAEIVREVLGQVPAEDSGSYRRWLEAVGRIRCQGHYVELVLSDLSRVTLRLGRNPDRWLHVHPSRRSPLCFRLRATTWSVALACLVLAGDPARIGKSVVDEARQLLGLPPVGVWPRALDPVLERAVLLTADTGGF